MLAVAYADGMTIGVIGTGDWSVEEALEVLEGIERRERTKKGPDGGGEAG